MEATLQVIMEQLRELPAGQSALKSEISATADLKTDMCAIATGQEVLKCEIRTTTNTEWKGDVCAEVKSDISKIRVEPMTQVLAMDNKMGNCMSAIREKLETQISDVRWASRTEREAFG